MARLGLGCVKLGSASFPTSKKAVAFVRAALDRGVDYFDTADSYGAGASESVLGLGLAGHRDQVTVATKGGYLFRERSGIERRARRLVAAARRRVTPAGTLRTGGSPGAYSEQDFSAHYLDRALEDSLRRLRTDHVDVYQLHGPKELDWEPLAAWADAAIASGKIGRLGIGAETLDEAARWSKPPVTSLQVPFGVLDPEAADRCIPEAAARGICVVARGVLGAGLVVGESSAHLSPAQRRTMASLGELATASGTPVTALAWWFVARRSDVDTMLVGTSSLGHLDEIARIATGPISTDTAAAVDAIAAAGSQA